MSDDVVRNMVAGYAHVDALVADGIDVFAIGNSRLLLELNTLVLCGPGPGGREEYARHRDRTEQHFYGEREGGIRDLVEWHARHAQDPPLARAAGLYVRMLSRPQLFIEGNHRTGALVMSYVLVRAGRPPFVLTAANALAYFEPSALIRDTHKQRLLMRLRAPRLTRRLAALLAAHADRGHVRSEPAPGSDHAPSQRGH